MPIDRFENPLTPEEIQRLKNQPAPDVCHNLACPELGCKSTMSLRTGMYGRFYGCKLFPKCRGIINCTESGAPDLNSVSTPATTRSLRAQLIQAREYAIERDPSPHRKSPSRASVGRLTQEKCAAEITKLCLEFPELSSILAQVSKPKEPPPSRWDLLTDDDVFT